jgi:hypothetical protein
MGTRERPCGSAQLFAEHRTGADRLQLRLRLRFRRQLTVGVRLPRQRPRDVSGIIGHRSSIVSQYRFDYDSVRTIHT